MKNYKDIKTFEDACKVEGIDPTSLTLDLTCFPETDRKSIEAYAKLAIVVRAANRQANDGEEWKADFSDYDQYKYEPWFELIKQEDGSSAFRYYVYAYWNSLTYVGSRLCFISREVCEYIANQFIDLYNEFLQ